MPFVRFTTDMRQSTLLACHALAFDYFGGIPKEILYDNMRTAFDPGEEGVWHSTRRLAACAVRYGFVLYRYGGAGMNRAPSPTDFLAGRMEELGLGFMAAGLESFLSEQAAKSQPLTESLSALLDIEYNARKEQTARTRLKLSGMTQAKCFEEFDLSWLKGGMSRERFEALKRLAFVERKENVLFYETGSIVMTSNKPFSKWAKLMWDEAVATAMLDRLLHHAQVVSLKADSYRMKDRLRVGTIGFE